MIRRGGPCSDAIVGRSTDASSIKVTSVVAVIDAIFVRNTETCQKLVTASLTYDAISEHCIHPLDTRTGRPLGCNLI
jgi:hypothetical protein